MKADIEPFPAALTGLGRLLLDIRRSAIDPSAVMTSLDSCARFLQTATPARILGGLLGPSSRSSELVASIMGLDHFGFMVPSASTDQLSAAAAAAGFDKNQWTLPSSIFSHELGLLVGRDEVDTTIFRALGLRSDGTPMEVETFVPRGVEPDLVSRWISVDVGAHIAFRVAEEISFDPISSVMNSVGFEMAPYLDGKARTNEAARLSVVYFDKRMGEFSIRLEFCHYHS